MIIASCGGGGGSSNTAPAPALSASRSAAPSDPPAASFSDGSTWQAARYTQVSSKGINRMLDGTLRADGNSSGQSVVVWIEPLPDDPNRFALWAQRNDPASGSSAPYAVSCPPGMARSACGFPFNPDVALDDSGNATVVWDGGNVTALYYSRFTATGWSAPKILPGTDTKATNYFPVVDADAAGNVTAVWRRYTEDNEPFSQNTVASRFTASGGWGVITKLNDRNQFVLDGVQVDVNASGQALVSWNDASGTLRTRRYNPVSGWAAVVPIAGHSGEKHYQAMNASGTAAIIFVKCMKTNGCSNDPDYSLIGHTGSAATGWSAPATIARVPQNFVFGQVPLAMDDQGNAIAVWHVSQPFGLMFSRYTAAAGWSTASLSEPMKTRTVFYPAIAMQADGTAIVTVGAFTSSGTYAWSARYAPTTGWDAMVAIDPLAVTDKPAAGFPVVMLPVRRGSRGFAAFWLLSTGTSFGTAMYQQ